MPTPANSLNISSAGIVGFDGTVTFNEIALTQNATLTGGATANTITQVGPGVLGQTFVGNSGAPTWSNNVPIKGPDPWCDVIAFGADPTGVADSATAINNAITQLGATGGTIYFPSGTYKIASTITITTPHARFIGASRTDCTLNFTGSATADMFAVNQWYCGFENLTFTVAANTQTAGYAINISNAQDYVYVWRCDFNNFWGGVLLGGHLCYIDDIQFRTFSNAAVNGNWVLLTNSHDRWISKVVGDNGSNLTGFAGIRVVQTASLLIRDCSLVHATKCLSLEPTVGLTVPSVESINNFYDTSTIGLSISGAGTVARCKFTNSWFSSMVNDGVQLNNANLSGLTFVNCDFYGNQNGINALAATDWCVMDSRFAGNTITGVITTAAAAHSFMILGNTIGPTSVFGANALGINIQSGTYASYKIKDNIGLQGNTTAGITDNGSVTGQNQKDISDNLGATIKGGISATTAASAAINTTETIIAGGVNTAVIPANSLQIGTTIRITTLGTCTASVANASTWTLRMGTAGTTGDASVATGAVTSAATGTTIGFASIVEFTVRTIGSTGTIAGSLTVLNTGVAGISTNNTNVIPLTATATLNTTTANYIELTYKSAATTTTSTFQNGIVEIVKC